MSLVVILPHLRPRIQPECKLRDRMSSRNNISTCTPSFQRDVMQDNESIHRSQCLFDTPLRESSFETRPVKAHEDYDRAQNTSNRANDLCSEEIDRTIGFNSGRCRDSRRCIVAVTATIVIIILSSAISSNNDRYTSINVLREVTVARGRHVAVQASLQQRQRSRELPTAEPLERRHRLRTRRQTSRARRPPARRANDCPIPLSPIARQCYTRDISGLRAMQERAVPVASKVFVVDLVALLGGRKRDVNAPQLCFRCCR